MSLYWMLMWTTVIGGCLLMVYIAFKPEEAEGLNQSPNQKVRK